MTTNQTIDGVSRTFLAGCATWFERLGDVISVERAKELRVLLDAERCTSCDGSGDLIDLTGEWRGYCVCPTGVDLKNMPAAQSQGEPVTHGYVQPVPDHCDRITWRGSYFHLPIEQPAPVAVVLPERKRVHPGSPLYAEAEQWNACLDEVTRLNTK